MKRTPDHRPIEPKHYNVMNVLADLINDLLNGSVPAGTPKNGFALLVFPFGQPNDERRANYISNANREDMLAAMKEFIARNEGRFAEETGGPKQ